MLDVYHSETRSLIPIKVKREGSCLMEDFLPVTPKRIMGLKILIKDVCMLCTFPFILLSKTEVYEF